jgi:chromate transporter
MPSSEQISLLGATVALVFMFLPGFLLVSSALPMWQAISHSPAASNAIAGINAAVVGVLAAALYNPIFTSGISNVMDFIIGASAIAMLAKWRLSPLLVVVWCVVANIVATLALN